MMSQNSKELILEILSEEISPSSSSCSNDSFFSPEEDGDFAKSLNITPSPFKGEPVISAIELGQGEGKEHGLMNGVVVGVLKDINTQGQSLVDFPGNPLPDSAPARSVMPLGKSNITQDVVLVFEEGDLRKPIIMGVLQTPEKNPPERQPEEKGNSSHPVNVELDGKRVTLSAQKEIVLRCGKASITLTEAGKIVIRGAYVSSRSSGPNLIKGGSVQLN